MKSQFLAIALLGYILTGCATTHPGNVGHTTTNTKTLPILVSALSVDSYAKDPFQLIEITIENTSDSWVRFSRQDLVIDDALKAKLSVVTGRDLRDWAEATAFKLNKDEYNRSLLQGAILGAGVVAAGLSNNNNGRLVGASLITISSVSVVSDVLRKDFTHATGVRAVPESHFYTPFSVPAGMFMRRWLLLNKPANTLVSSIVVEFETVEGEKERYEVKLKSN